MTADQLRHTPYFALANKPDGEVSLFCFPYDDVHDKDCVHFSVINGGWDGLFLPEENKIAFVGHPNDRNKGRCEAEMPAFLVWAGKLPHKQSTEYNAAIDWINSELKSVRGLGMTL